MRLGLGIALIYFGTASLLAGSGAPVAVAQRVIEAATGILLIAGLWTPVTASLAALDQIWIAFSLESFEQNLMWMYLFLAVLSASVAMLGPGAWSIDAHLYGRRRLARDRNRTRRPDF